MAPADSKQFFAEITRVLEQIAHETHRSINDRGFRESLRGAAARAEELHQAIGTTQDRADVLRQELAGLIAQIMLQANEFTTELIRTSATTAQEAIAAAKAEGDDAIRSAQARAQETLRDARKVADDTVASAKALAEKITDVARADAEGTIQEARRRVVEIEQAAEKRVGDLIAKVEAFAPQHEQISQSLKTMANGYTGLAQELARLHAEGEEKILPTLRDTLQALRNESGTQRAQSSTEDLQPSEAPASSAPVDAGTDRRDTHNAPDCTKEAAAPRSAEIILQHVSNEEAAAFVDALPELRGIRAALLQTFYQAAEVATIDVLTEIPLNTLDLSLLSEFEVEVIAAAEDILTLHVRAKST